MYKLINYGYPMNMKWISYYIYYSILGFLFETTCNIFIRSNHSSGILFGPFTPIYFFGFLIIVFLDKILEKQENKKFRALIFLILSFISLTLVEFVGGHLSYLIIGHAKWSYENWPLSIGKYINILVSLGWSVGAFIYDKYFLKKVNRIIDRMPKKLTLLLVGLYLLDTFLSFKNGF